MANEKRDTEAEVLRQIADASPALLFQLRRTPDGRIEVPYVSRATHHFFGVGSEGPMKDFRTFNSLLHEGDAERIAKGLDNSTQDMQSRDMEFRVKRADGGDSRWVKAVVTPRRAQDGGTIWDGVLVDIGAQKDAERQLRDVTDNIPGVVFQRRQTADGRISFPFLSKGFYRLNPKLQWGDYANIQETLQGIHPDDFQKGIDAVRVSAETMQPYTVDYRLALADGSYRWMRGSGVPRREADGSIVWNGYTVDIHEAHIAEIEIATAEHQFREMTDRLPGVLFQQRLEPDGRLWSPFAGGNLGLLPEEMQRVREKGARLMDLLLPEDRMMVAKAVAESARSLMPYRVEYRVRQRDGSVAWLRTEAQPHRTEDGVVVWNGFSANISHEKEAEGRISEITQALPGVVFQLRMNAKGAMRYTFVTDNSLKVLGLVADTILADVMALHDRVQVADLVGMTKRFGESLSSGATTSVECRYHHPDGQLRWLRITATPRHGLDREAIWNGHTVDITAEREAQQRLTDVTKTMPGAVFQLVPNADNRLVVSFVSDGIESLVGIPVAEVLRNENPLNDIIIEQDRPIMNRVLRDSLRAKSNGICDVRVRHAKTGKLMWIRAAASPNLDNPKRVTWSGFWWDITDIKELQAELGAAREAAEGASRVKSEFLANMSHEIRTPMNAILGLSHLLLKSDPPAKIKDHLQKIDRAARSLLGVINDILDFSRIEAGKMSLEQTPFSLDTVLEDLANLAGQGAHEKGLMFSCKAGAEVPRDLVGDPLRLGQVLLNLVSNAVKFTERGYVRIHVERVREVAGRVELRFVVEDTGIGLNPEQIARLFSSFSQADASTTRKYGGSGLGLSICKNLVELMGGRIGVDSEAGRGSRFWFTVSLAQSDTPVRARPTVTGGHPLEGLSILVAEDNDISREIAREVLESVGAKVIAVADGQLAVEALQGGRCDAVVMDLNMPRMNGIEATRAIRADARYGTLPIIAMTASAMADDRERCLAAGMNAHVSKPIDIQELVEVLGKLTRGIQVGSVESKAPARLPPDLKPLATLIELPSALRRLNHNASAYRRLLRAFADGHANWNAAIDEALAHKDRMTLEMLSHSLKGSAANLGAQAVSAAAAELEHEVHTANPENLTARVRAVQNALSALLKALAPLREAAREQLAAQNLDSVQLRALNQHLAQHDAKAVKLALKLAEAFPEEPVFGQLHRQASAYDFEAARITLLKLSARLKIPL